MGERWPPWLRRPCLLGRPPVLARRRGAGGLRARRGAADKREGDGASPAGTFPLVRAFYRPDRLAPPPTGLPLAPLRPNDGWVDDPADPQYNRLVALPYPAHHEEMWRADGLYDLVVVIGYNTDPPVPGRGSAIFLHVARPDLAPTEGCIAVAREVLVAGCWPARAGQHDHDPALTKPPAF